LQCVIFIPQFYTLHIFVIEHFLGYLLTINVCFSTLKGQWQSTLKVFDFVMFPHSTPLLKTFVKSLA